jgi:hypothetical protein
VQEQDIRVPGNAHMKNCPERDKLERLIRETVREIASNSGWAANIAGGGQHQRFEHLQTNHAVLAERLRVLKECLQLHQGLHEC